MKSFGKYITKYLASFAGFIVLLVFLNILIYGLTFYGIIAKDYGTDSPQKILEEMVSSSSWLGVSDETAAFLKQRNIWAMFLNDGGQVIWSAQLPEEIPTIYSIGEVTVFAKGYIKDYPVFVRSVEDGLLVLGYPKDSYVKITSNYYPMSLVRTFPIFILLILAADSLLVFIAYFFSKRKIMNSAESIVNSIESLSQGKPVSLPTGGELSEIAEGLNRASAILSKQNEARANFIAGVSHDIRTPLSMIMGYADRIVTDKIVSGETNEQAEIIRKQSVKIKELVQDLNLVSQLEYEMHPIQKASVRMSKLLREFTADLLNSGLSQIHSIEVKIASNADRLVFECDARLISRAVNNLVQNSIRHNPSGCGITLALECHDKSFRLTVSDTGVGISTEKLQQLSSKTHYLDSIDESLNLRHGLGLLLVKQITKAHSGTMVIGNSQQGGFETALLFSITK